MLFVEKIGLLFCIDTSSTVHGKHNEIFQQICIRFRVLHYTKYCLPVNLHDIGLACWQLLKSAAFVCLSLYYLYFYYERKERKKKPEYSVSERVQGGLGYAKAYFVPWIFDQHSTHSYLHVRFCLPFTDVFIYVRM